MRHKLFGIISIVALLFIADIAEAQYGHAHRATRRRTAVVVASATHAADEQAAAEQQAAEDQAAADQKAADDEAAAKQAEAAKQEQVAAPAPEQGEHLPYGTIVSKLPDGCEAVVVGDVQYYHCGNDYYRVAYQESNIVYVSTEPPATK